MNFLDKLERKYGKYAIHNLMSYIVLGNGIIFLLSMLGVVSPEIFYFNWRAILQGEWWRLFTFIFIPQNMSIIWIIFAVMLYYSIGSALEEVWGTFKFNIYYLTGVLGTIVVAALLNMSASSNYINLSLFLGFATLFPDVEFRIYFLIPVKAKYMAIFYFALITVDVLTGGLPTFILIFISLLNYFLFFGIPAINRLKRRRTHTTYKKSYNRKVNKDHIPKGSKEPIKVAFHKCHVCGVTEVDQPDMEFRYCSKCNGHYEYCMEHLKNHTHIE